MDKFSFFLKHSFQFHFQILPSQLFFIIVVTIAIITSDWTLIYFCVVYASLYFLSFHRMKVFFPFLFLFHM